MGNEKQKKPLDPNTLPPKLRVLYEEARRLAHVRMQKTLWANTLKALSK